MHDEPRRNTHPFSQEDEDDLQRRKLALKKLLAIRESQVDKQPVLVEDGLFVGPGGALLPTGHFTNSKRRWHRGGKQQTRIATNRHHRYCVCLCCRPCLLPQAARLPPRARV